MASNCTLELLSQSFIGMINLSKENCSALRRQVTLNLKKISKIYFAKKCVGDLRSFGFRSEVQP